ncbi:MPPV-205 conserved hypothetical protein [Magpiepox virus 2]|nr:conserved hypothetical protein [Magpiepox virus]QZW33513.1 MPPV-205 conserved hypothetical protein [Magpiepox virus 2]
MSMCNNTTVCVHSLDTEELCYKWLPIRSRYLQDYELISYMTKKFNKLFTARKLNIFAKYYWINTINRISIIGEHRPWVMSFINTTTRKRIADFRLDRSYPDSRMNSIIVDSFTGKIICEGIGLIDMLRSNGIDFIKDKLFSEDEIVNHLVGVKKLKDLCIKCINKTVKKELCDQLSLPTTLLNEVKRSYK